MAKVSGLNDIKRNINAIKKEVSRSTVRVVNKEATNTVNHSVKSVANDIGVPIKTIKGRVQRKNAKQRTPFVKLRINRMDMPAIRLFENKRNKLWVGRGGIVVGKYAMKHGFVQRLKNGRTHIMQRKSGARYPIDVVKIPLSGKLTTAFKAETNKYPNAVQKALRIELIKRGIIS